MGESATALLRLVPLAVVSLVTPACGAGEMSLHLTNADSVALDSVRVSTNGFSYDLGTIAPGQSDSLTVEAYGEGSLSIAFAGDPGARILLLPYFQAGDPAAVDARLWRDSARVRTRYRYADEWSPVRSRVSVD